MAASFDQTSVLEALSTVGYWDASLDFDTDLQVTRFHRTTLPECLATLQTPPPHDADLTPAVDRLRIRIKRALNVTSGPPVLLTQILAAAFGYRGSPIRSTAEGIRVLLKVPEIDDADLSSLFTVAPGSSDSTTVTASVTTDPARVDSSRLDRLEETLAQLQRNLTQTVASAVQAALASHKPPVGTADLTAIPATQVLSPARASKPAKAPQAKPAAEVTDVDMGSPSHPPWEFKSGSPVMEVLGSVYSHLIATGAEGLAADLFSVRAEIDYAFMLPAEASSEEPEANVYTSKYSKKRWKRDHPAPGRCFECHGPHWRENCPVAAKKTENSASRTLQRGAPPPGRYYISKGGQVFDTTRRPLQECKRCSGKYHWFWNCSRGPEVLHIPRGASFTNTVDVRPVNASGATL